MLHLASSHPWDRLPRWPSGIESAYQESQEMWVPSLGQGVPLEKEMAAHSSILAWEIPWTEEGAWQAKSMRS